MMWSLAVIVAIGLSPPAAASCARSPRPTYCTDSIRAIVGTVTARSAPYTQQGFTLTDVTVQVERTLAGASLEQVTFPVMGRTAPDGRAIELPGGAPRLDVGSRHALILAGAPDTALLMCGTARRLDPDAVLYSVESLAAQWAAGCAESGASGPPIIAYLSSE